MYNQTNEQPTDDRGVSPVIGVVLMIAVTVILTGVIATFVLSFGAEAKAPPQATLSIEQNDTDAIDISHLSGEVVDLNELYIRGDVSSEGWSPEDETLRGGESITVNLDEQPEPDDVITLVWDVGTDATILAEHHWTDSD